MRLFLRKSKAGRESEPVKGETRFFTESDLKLAYFRKLIMDHLGKLEDGGMEKSRAMAIGTISDRKGGVRYIKTGKNKWVKKYDSHSQGAKMAIAAIKRKISSAKDAREMMQIVLENRDRFSDKDGHPLPFVQELSKYVSERQDNPPENIKAKGEEAGQGKGAGGGDDGKPPDRAGIKTLNPAEFKDFIEDAVKDRHSKNRRVQIGAINADAQKRIEKISGQKVSAIDIDKENIRHSLKKNEHNLKPEDRAYLIFCVNAQVSSERNPFLSKLNGELV